MKKIISGFTILFLFINTIPAFAVGSAGFENASFSAASLGQSNAVVAQADEPATISYNPAGITQLNGVQVQGNTAFISIFNRRRAPSGDINQSSGTLVAVPTGYLTINPGQLLKDRLVLGVGSDSPFGLSNKYDSNHSHVHYAGWRNYLKMYTIKPVAALKINEKLSIGAGPMYYRIFDFGGIQAYPNVLLGGAFPDGQVRLNLSGNNWGWNMGILAKPHEKHQLGLYFRSPVTVRTRGRVKVEGATVGGRFETAGKAKVDLPLNLTLGYAFKPNKKFTIETDLGYTRWAAHKRLFFDTDPVDASNDAILAAIGKNDKDWSDSMALHLGGKYQYTPKLAFSAGSLFYWAAVPKDHFIPAVPDANGFGLSLGANYDLTKNLKVDLTYFNRFWLRRQIDNSIGEVIGASVDGRYTTYCQEFVISVTYKWGHDDKQNKPEVSQVENKLS